MNEITAQNNFNYITDTIALKNSIEISYINLAQRLNEILVKRMWEPNYESFEEFLEDIKISGKKAHRMILMWNKLVVEYQIPEHKIITAGGWTVVETVMQYARDRATAEEWLEIAQHNTRSDLRKLILEAKTGIKMELCSHKNKEVITFERCLDCGDSRRLYENNK